MAPIHCWPARCQLHHFWAPKIPHDEVMLTLREKDNAPAVCTEHRACFKLYNCSTPGMWCPATGHIDITMITDVLLHEKSCHHQLQNELSDDTTVQQIWGLGKRHGRDLVGLANSRAQIPNMKSLFLGQLPFSCNLQPKLQKKVFSTFCHLLKCMFSTKDKVKNRFAILNRGR